MNFKICECGAVYFETEQEKAAAERPGASVSHVPVGHICPKTTRDLPAPNPVPRAVSHVSPEISRKYLRYRNWLDANPDLVGVAVEVCKKEMAKGMESYSGQAIGERVRWHYRVERGMEDFKVNNDFLPYLTRDINLALGKEFCEVRASQADADMDYRRRMEPPTPEPDVEAP
jgi:hypothetical protein